MKTVIISWGFENKTNKPYMDCYQEIENPKDGAAEIKYIAWSSRSMGTHLALLRVPNSCQRKDIELYIKLCEEEAVKLLQKARIEEYEVSRRNYLNQAIDFIIN